MELLKKEQTNTTPLVNLNPDDGVFVFAGYSRPENVREVYMPIINWLYRFKEELASKRANGTEIAPIYFDFQLIYFNSSSAKYLYDIVTLLNEIREEGTDLTIRWHYDKDDPELREAGEELSELAQVPFIFTQH